MIIYMVRNTVTGKIYIGQTHRSLEERWKAHCYDALYKESNNLFHSSILKHGIDSFEVEVLAKAFSQEELDQLEKHYIDTLSTMNPNGYNLKTGGQNGCQFSEESKQKMASAKLGTTVSEEVRAKMSESHKKFWTNNEEASQQRSEQSKKAWQDPAYREKISQARTEYWSDPENRVRMTKQAKEFTTEEQKQKISEAVKASHERPEVKAKLDAFHDSRKKKVIDSNGVTYESIKKAAEVVGCKASSIIRMLKGVYKTAGGLTWRYIDET
jgi:group I intron endonuclease